MYKDYDLWNNAKKDLDEKKTSLFFKEGEIWWVHLGINIGFEMNGKSKYFSRPVLIVKKYNKFSFLGIPLSTSTNYNQYRIDIGNVDGKNASANVSQLKNLDFRRLIIKITSINKKKFLEIKEKTSRANFG